jgi:hypothetical protein
MKVINDLHQLIRDNYDKIAEMPKEFGNIEIGMANDEQWIILYYKSINTRIAIHKKYPKSDEITSPLPFNEQLWEDFYNELKEALNA